jgi:serine/threonine protein kinase
MAHRTIAKQGGDHGQQINILHDSSASEMPRPLPASYRGTYLAEAFVAKGLWSSVWRAKEIIKAHASANTPPESPAGTGSAARILAIKKPLESRGVAIIRREASILTWLFGGSLAGFGDAASHVVAFHGFDTSCDGLVMDFVPETLEAFAADSLKRSRDGFSTRTMFDPVVGVAQWKSLAKDLVAGLAWLHGQGCIHGDIKSANILLRSRGEGGDGDDAGDTLKPLYCDFSSSRLLLPGSGPAFADPDDDAMTPAYAAPELLEGYRKRGQGVGPTAESDIFSLGVTLIVAARGEEPYAGAASELQKLAMAREGRPLEMEPSTRTMKGKFVHNSVEGAVAKRIDDRWNMEQWIAVVEDLQA